MYIFFKITPLSINAQTVVSKERLAIQNVKDNFTEKLKNK
jgi:hypothetical protein